MTHRWSRLEWVADFVDLSNGSSLELVASSNWLRVSNSDAFLQDRSTSCPFLFFFTLNDSTIVGQIVNINEIFVLSDLIPCSVGANCFIYASIS